MAWTPPEKDTIVSNKKSWSPPEKDTIDNSNESKPSPELPNTNIKYSPKEIIDSSYKWNVGESKDTEIPHAVQVSGLPQLKDVNLPEKLDLQKQASQLRYNDAKNIYDKTDLELNSLNNKIKQSDALLNYYGKDNINYPNELKNNVELKEKIIPVEQRHKSLTSLVDNNKKEIDNLGKQLDSLNAPVGESYLGGAIRSGAESTAKLLDDVHGASEAVTNFLGLPSTPVYKDMANSLRRSVSGIPEEPKNIIGNTIGGLTGMAPLVVENLLFPEYKYAPSLPQSLAFNAFGDSYNKGLSAKQTLENVYEATQEGYVMHGLGLGAKSAGKLVEDLSKNKVLGGAAAAIVAGGGFGGADAIKQYVNTGKVDMDKVWENIGMGVAFELPTFIKAIHAKAVDTFIKSSEESINQAANIDKTTEEIRNEAIHTVNSAAESKDPDLKEQRIVAANVLNATADLKAVVPAIIHDKEAFVNLVNDRTDLTVDQKESVIKKINAVYDKNHPVLKELEPLRNEFNTINEKIDANKDKSEIDREILNAPLEKRKKEIMTEVTDFLKTKEKSKQEIIKEKPKEVSSEIKDANQKAKIFGFDEATHLLNSVKKHTGQEFEKVQDVPLNVIEETVNKREAENEQKELPIKTEATPTKKYIANKELEDAKMAFKKKLGLGSGGQFQALPELINLAKAYVKLGYVTAKDFISQFRKDFPDADIDDDNLKSHFESANKKEEEQKITGIKKSQVSSEREKRGESPLEKTMKESHEDLMTNAIKLNKENPEAKNKLTEELIENPRPIQNHEAALLAIKKSDLKNKWDEAYDKREQALKSGDENSIQQAKVEFNAVDKELNDFEKAVKASGAKTAKGLKAMDILVNDEYELQSQIAKYKETNKGEITPDVEAKFKEYDEQLKAKNKEIRDLQKKIDEEENKKSEDFIDKSIKEIVREHNKQERKASKEYLKEERKSILGDIKEKLKNRRQTLSAGIPIPVEILPDVAKLTKNYIKEGVINVEQLVDNVYNDLKDYVEGLDKRTVRDTISGYGQKKKEFTRSELAKQQTEVRKIARLMSKLEDLESGKKPAKSERERQEQSKEVSELKNKIKEFNKTYVLKGEIYKSELERDAIKEKFDIEQEKARLKNRPLGEKVTETFVDIVNIPKSLMASADFSAPLRQGLILGIKHPIMASKAAVEMFRQAFSERKSIEWMRELRSSQAYKVMKKSGLYLSEPTTRLSAKEEQFVSNISHRVPIWGNVVKGSERAYTGYLNKLRADVFSQFHDNLIDAGFKGEELQKELNSFSKFINNASGRGNLGKLENAAPLLNTTFFSPRYVASRFHLINPVNYVKMESRARMEAMKSMAAYIGVGSMVLALAKAGGAKVEEDPRSSDFGKIRIGKIRADIWAGEQQLVRLISQIATNSYKPIGGKVKKLGKGYKADTQVDVAEKFIRSKLSPSASAVVDYMSSEKRGKFKNMVGEEKNVQQKALELIAPLWISDIKSVYKQKGLGAAIGVGAASFFGVGVQNYDNKKK